jgi:hypothetical protein
MTDDTDPVALLEQAAALLRLQPRQRTWIDAFRDGAVLTASEAARVAENDAQSIRRWCEAREAEHPDRPLGWQVGKLWLVDAGELLDEIEKRRDLHARRVAESNLMQLLEQRRASPQSIAPPERAMG